jgi:hypothetical protein
MNTIIEAGQPHQDLNHQFNTILFGSLGYLVGAVHGRQYWTNQKEFALRFRGAEPAEIFARSIAAATLVMDYFDDGADLGPIDMRKAR